MGMTAMSRYGVKRDEAEKKKKILMLVGKGSISINLQQISACNKRIHTLTSVQTVESNLTFTLNSSF